MDEKERNIIDDPTGIDRSDLEQSCAFILHNIEQIYSNADQWDSVTDEINGISPRNFDTYVMSLRYRQDLPIKTLKVSSYEILDNNELYKLYDYVQTYPSEDVPLRYPQKIYVIEGSKSAITIIPIQVERESIVVQMELLDKSPQFIRDLWKDKNTPKGLEGIKFVDPKDLKTKDRKNKR